MNNLSVEVGKRIRKIRNARGWTLEQLAERTDIAESYLMRIESA